MLANRSIRRWRCFASGCTARPVRPTNLGIGRTMNARSRIASSRPQQRQYPTDPSLVSKCPTPAKATRIVRYRQASHDRCESDNKGCPATADGARHVGPVRRWPTRSRRRIRVDANSRTADSASCSTHITHVRQFDIADRALRWPGASWRAAIARSRHPVDRAQKIADDHHPRRSGRRSIDGNRRRSPPRRSLRIMVRNIVC